MRGIISFKWGLSAKVISKEIIFKALIRRKDQNIDVTFEAIEINFAHRLLGGK